VRRPRHLVVYRPSDEIIDVLAFIHEREDPLRHLDAGDEPVET